MQRELDLDMAAGGGGPDTNNLMRLIQGTVAPQVGWLSDLLSLFVSSSQYVVIGAAIWFWKPNKKNLQG